MAWSSANLSATVRSLMAADKPLCVGSNLVRNLTSTTIQWRTGGSWAAGADGTDANGPTAGLYDGWTHKQSYPGSSVDPWYLIMDFGALKTFDTVAIINHNFASIAGMVVTLEIADTSNFVTNLQAIATWTPGSSTKRLVNFNMDHTGASTARAYTTQYARLKLDPTAASIPKIGELVLGSRRQLKHQPNIPWDPDMRRAVLDEMTTYSGVVTRTVHYRGQRTIKAKLTPAETAYTSDLISLYATDTNYGTLPFLWVDKPTTTPNGAYLMLMDPAFTMPYGGPNLRSLDIEAIEQGPHFADLET